MTYLSRGKRDILAEEYRVEMARWAKHFGVPPPEVRVRTKGAAFRFSKSGGRVWLNLPPGCGRATLCHEFAHYYAHVVANDHSHGVVFRACLVEVAAIVFGQARRYPWAAEYASIQAWARKHGLLSREDA
jgi:hypothetical protein